MSETVAKLPKGDPGRVAIAKQIRKIRNIERAGLYETGRDGQKYVQELLGVQHLFDHVRNLGTSNKVLDIGAGVTLGTYELSTSSLGQGLIFDATVLHRDPNITQYLGNERVHVTSTEVLRGVADNSIGVAIAVHSVGYSDRANLAITSINRVLMPGGVFKATFYKGENDTDTQNVVGFKGYKDFQLALQELGYDVAVDETSATANILLAIKPGSDTKAADLIEADKKTVKEQLTIMIKEKMQRGQYKDLLDDE